MTLEQLRIFVAVAERLHVTQAAQALNISQSAASAAIAALEGRYAVRLFDRVGRHIELTHAGRVFLEEARTVLVRAKAAEFALNDLAGLRRGTLSLFASQTIANYWLPPLLHQFHQAYPGIEIDLTIGNTEQAVQAVCSGAAEVGFAEGEVDGGDLSVRHVPGDKLVLIVPPQHAWAQTPAIAPDDLLSARWVLREVGSGTRSMFEEALAAQGLDAAKLKVVLELPSNEAVRTAVRHGAGATVISELVAEPGLRSGALVKVEFPLPSRRFLILTHRERYVSHAEKALLALIEERVGGD